MSSGLAEDAFDCSRFSSSMLLEDRSSFSLPPGWPLDCIDCEDFRDDVSEVKDREARSKDLRARMVMVGIHAPTRAKAVSRIDQIVVRAV